MSIYLVGYRPLVLYPKGKKAIKNYGNAPFVDHSIRREPNFEYPHIGISSLCRADLLVNRLELGDTIVYMTVKGRYYQDRGSHYCLTAVLRVSNTFESHQEAAIWYQQNNYSIPANCVIRGNPHLPIDQTVMSPKWAREAEAAYIARSRKCPKYVIAQPDPLFPKVDLYTPPSLSADDLYRTMGLKQAPQGVFIVKQQNQLSNLLSSLHYRVRVLNM